MELRRLGAGTLNLPDSKTGAKVVHIGKPAVDVLRRIPPLPGNPWVITGKLPGSRLSDLQPFWQRVRARAGLKDARIHDLRHTFASAAVAAGQGLPMIGKLLGPHAGGDDGTLRASRRGSGEGGGGAGVVDDCLGAWLIKFNPGNFQ